MAATLFVLYIPREKGDGSEDEIEGSIPRNNSAAEDLNAPAESETGGEKDTPPDEASVKDQAGDDSITPDPDSGPDSGIETVDALSLPQTKAVTTSTGSLSFLPDADPEDPKSLKRNDASSASLSSMGGDDKRPKGKLQRQDGTDQMGSKEEIAVDQVELVTEYFTLEEVRIIQVSSYDMLVNVTMPQ